MEKEVLTKERILQDYKDNRRSTFKGAIRLLIILICVSIPLVYLTISILEHGFDFYSVWVVIIVAMYIGVCVVGLIFYYKDYQNVKQGRFYVVTDELIGKQEPETYPVRYLNTFNKSAELKFKTYGSYTVISNHTSSNPDPYAVSDVDNYITSTVGDEFLLVINRKSQVLLAYNTKLFEYHG